MARRERKSSSHKRQSEHHVRPRSRGGTDAEQFSWPESDDPDDEKHRSWHTLFSNLMVPEVLAILPLWANRDGSLNTELMNPVLKEAWAKLFGADTTPEQAARIIVKTFGRKRMRHYLIWMLDGRTVDEYLAQVRENFELLTRGQPTP